MSLEELKIYFQSLYKPMNKRDLYTGIVILLEKDQNYNYDESKMIESMRRSVLLKVKNRFFDLEENHLLQEKVENKAVNYLYDSNSLVPFSAITEEEEFTREEALELLKSKKLKIKQLERTKRI